MRCGWRSFFRFVGTVHSPKFVDSQSTGWEGFRQRVEWEGERNKLEKTNKPERKTPTHFRCPGYRFSNVISSINSSISSSLAHSTSSRASASAILGGNVDGMALGCDFACSYCSFSLTTWHDPHNLFKTQE